MRRPSWTKCKRSKTPFRGYFDVSIPTYPTQRVSCTDQIKGDSTIFTEVGAAPAALTVVDILVVVGPLNSAPLTPCSPSRPSIPTRIKLVVALRLPHPNPAACYNRSSTSRVSRLDSVCRCHCAWSTSNGRSSNQSPSCKPSIRTLMMHFYIVYPKSCWLPLLSLMGLGDSRR